MKTNIEMKIKNDGVVIIELDDTYAPLTVSNFLKLVDEGYYNGLTFHRVIPGFMVQGGCPLGTGTGGPGYSIKGEFSSNGVDNPMNHGRGVISMARAMDPNSAGSQFFIMVENAPHLDGQYASFGIVTEGMDIVDRIVAVKRNPMDKPLEDVVIESMKRL